MNEYTFVFKQADAGFWFEKHGPTSQALNSLLFVSNDQVNVKWYDIEVASADDNCTVTAKTDYDIIMEKYNEYRESRGLTDPT